MADAKTADKTEPWIGRAIARREDERLLRGLGSYTDDFGPDAAEAAFVRSDHAHARVLDVDVSAALDLPGVVAVFTHEDLAGPFAERLPLLVPHDGLVAPMTQHALAAGEVSYAGQTIAMVVAQDRYVAEDAAGAVVVTYEPLTPIVDLLEARDGHICAHETLTSNVCSTVSEEKGDVDAALESSAHRFAWTFDIERSASMSMEGRAVFAHHDRRAGRLFVVDSTQAPTGIRAGLALMFGLDVEAVEVVAPDVGGGFGAKIMQFYPEEVLIPWAASRLDRPVKWTEDRREHFVGTHHERRQVHRVEVGCDEDGRITALETRFAHDCGAFCPYGLIVPLVTCAQLPGPYRLDNYRYTMEAVFTNTVPVTPYRGSGRPQGVFVMERVLDRIAAELELDRAEVRRRNFVQPDEFPHPVGVTFQDGGPTVYDSGEYPQGLALLTERIGWEAFGAERERARAEGRTIGIGLGCYVEGTGIGPYEGAVVNVLGDGRVTVATGLSTQGQGHQTTLAQIAADQLGVDVGAVMVTTGDTRRIGYGVGTFASRTAVVAGSAVHLAAGEVRRQAAALAAELLDCDADELVFERGQVARRDDPDAGLRLGQLATVANPLRYAFGGEDAAAAARMARQAYAKRATPLAEGDSPGLNATVYFSPESAVFGFGMHAAIVELDPVSCDVRVLRYVIVHDCGTVINPLIVDGQVYGGFAQGLGGALYEQLHYSPQGQLLNASFMDFLIPYATEVPEPELLHTSTPTTRNPLGVKGVGEAGTIPVSATIANAVSDAIGRPLDRMPLSPKELFALLHES